MEILERVSIIGVLLGLRLKIENILWELSIFWERMCVNERRAKKKVEGQFLAVKDNTQFLIYL